MHPGMVTLAKLMMPPLTWLTASFVPGLSRRIALREVHNKLEIMDLVRKVEGFLPSDISSSSLRELTEQCYQLGDFPALWAVEGLGHHWADGAYERKEVPKGLLTTESSADLPDKSMTMLHAGIGLSFAQHELKDVTVKSPALTVRESLERFLVLCRESSRPGYTGAAIESLGLVTRFFKGPRAALLVAEQLSLLEPDVCGFFWRGAGRALYFSPGNFLPGFGLPCRALTMAEREGPDAPAISNLTSGLVWAITLVNMRHPVVMEHFLLHHGRSLDLEILSNGVMAATVMRCDTTPDDPHIASFRGHEPGAESGLREIWEKYVRSACDLAVEVVHPVLKEHRRLEEVFRYQPLLALVERLGGPDNPPKVPGARRLD